MSFERGIQAMSPLFHPDSNSSYQQRSVGGYTLSQLSIPAQDRAQGGTTEDDALSGVRRAILADRDERHVLPVI